jgi:hypothetical protein
MLFIVLTRGSVVPRSSFVIAISDTPDAWARSDCVQPMRARAARIWALVIFIIDRHSGANEIRKSGPDISPVAVRPNLFQTPAVYYNSGNRKSCDKNGLQLSDHILRSHYCYGVPRRSTPAQKQIRESPVRQPWILRQIGTSLLQHELPILRDTSA